MFLCEGSLKKLLGWLITWRNTSYFLISRMVLGLFNQQQIFWQLYLIESLWAFSSSGATQAVALDISKVFDRVWLVIFFTGFSLMDQIFDLILPFLSNRWLPVVPDGYHPQEYPADAGVPQGSTLVPTYFLWYINDLPDYVICNIAIYAHDTILYSKRNQASVATTRIGRVWFNFFKNDS